MQTIKLIPKVKNAIRGLGLGLLIGFSLFAFVYLYMQNQNLEVNDAHKYISAVHVEEGIISLIAKSVKVLLGFY